jgi:hypothetical protein
MISYGSASHAFPVIGTEGYREESDEKFWKRFGDFLKEALKGIQATLRNSTFLTPLVKSMVLQIMSRLSVRAVFR